MTVRYVALSIHPDDMTILALLDGSLLVDESLLPFHEKTSTLLHKWFEITDTTSVIPLVFNSHVTFSRLEDCVENLSLFNTSCYIDLLPLLFLHNGRKRDKVLLNSFMTSYKIEKRKPFNSLQEAWVLSKLYNIYRGNKKCVE